MDGFFLDNQRKLVVKLSIRNSSPPASGGGVNPAAANRTKPSDPVSIGSDAPSTPSGGGKSVWVPRGNRQ